MCSPTDPLCSGGGGAAASVTKTAGDGQSAGVGAAVPTPPAVTVRDAGGNPVSGASVTFAVTAGGGSVTGSPATSNATGVATVGSWTLGANTGANTLTATVGSLPVVTFTATATDPCDAVVPLAPGTTSNGALATTDWELDNGSFFDAYSLTIANANAFRFTQASTAFDAYLYLLTSSAALIAENDDDVGLNSGIKALLPAGAYLVGASSLAAAATGAYTVSSATTATSVVNCEDVYVVRGLTTTQTVANTDCQDLTFFGDSFWIFLAGGQSVTIRHASTAFDAFLELYDGSDTVVASNDNAIGTDAQIVYTPTTAGYHRIFASTAASGATGAYTLTLP